MEIEWDLRKAAENLEKHGVSFEEAASSMLDPLALAKRARPHRENPVGFGWYARNAAPTDRGIYTVRQEHRIRLISARKATRKEAESYA